jgi:transcription antitermination factor NusG
LTPTGLGHRVESKPVRRAPRGLYMIGQAGGDGWSGQYGWYAVRVGPNTERPFIEYLKANQDELMAGLGNPAFEVFTPLEVERVQVRNGRGNTRGKVKWVETIKPYFPGYIFVRVAMCGEFCRRMRSEKSVVGFVTGALDALPALISEAEIARFMGGPIKVEAENPYSVGEAIRPVDGPFAGVEAPVAKVDSPDKVGVFLNLFNQPVYAEFGIGQVERVASRTLRAPA